MCGDDQQREEGGKPVSKRVGVNWWENATIRAGGITAGLKLQRVSEIEQPQEGQVGYGSMRRSSASLHTLSAGTPGASVWPSPRKMPGPSPSP